MKRKKEPTEVNVKKLPEVDGYWLYNICTICSLIMTLLGLVPH